MVPAVEGSSPFTHPNHFLPAPDRGPGIERPLIPGQTVIRIGDLCYRYRQYVSMALLATSIVAARPLTTSPGAELGLNVAAFALVILGGSIRSWAMGYHAWRRVRGPGPKRRQDRKSVV